MYRIVITLFLLSVSIMVGCQGTSFRPTDPAGVMDAYTKALNSHDIEGALAFVDDAAVYLRPAGEFSGKDQVRGFVKSLVDQKVKSELVGQRQVTGERVTWTSRITLTGANGIATTSQNASESTVRNGKIVRHQATRMP